MASRRTRGRRRRPRAAAARSGGTPRPRSSTRTRCGATRACSPQAGRSSSTPAATRAARPTTSSSSREPAPRTASGGARSTSRSSEERSRRCATRSPRTSASASSTSSTRSRAPTRRTGSRSASSRPSPTTRSSRGRCSSRRPTTSSSASSREAVVLHAPGLEADPAADGTRTGTFIALHPSRQEVLIGGTFYAGEIKKSIFTLMNDRLPLEGVFPMHCSANVGDDGDVAIFFGLSGTGKTTLSADPQRRLIGDDEHGLGRRGRLQLRGRLLREGDPALGRGRAGDLRDDAHLRDAARERRRRRAGRLDLDNDRRPRTRARRTSSSGSRTPCRTKQAGHPANVVFLTADAFAVMPPIARLSADAGALLLPLRLHGAARRHRDRRHRAGADVLALLRRPVPAAAAGGLRAAPRREARPPRPERVARQHGLDRRAGGRGPSDADPGDARAPARSALGRARRRRVPHRRGVRLRGAGRGARRRPGACSTRARPGTTRPLRRQGPRARADVPRELRRFEHVEPEVAAAGPIV